MVFMTFQRMSNTTRLVLFSLAMLLTTINSASAAPYPDFSGAVVDQADLLSRSTRAQLSRDLRSHQDQYGDQVVLATVQSLDGVNVAQYALGLARHWQLGQSGADNGVLILFAPEERQMRIEVGYGLETTLTDVQARDIINQHIRPPFQSGDFDAGARAGVREVLNTLRNPGAAATDNSGKNTLTMAIPVLFAGLFALAHYFRKQIGRGAINILVMSGVIGMVANVISERWYVGVAVALIAALVLHKRGHGRGSGTGSHSAIDGALPPRHYANPEDPTEYRDQPGSARARRSGTRPGSSGGGGGGGGFGGGGASGGW